MRPSERPGDAPTPRTPIPERDSESPYRADRNGALLETHLPFPKRAGKVRDVYDLGDRLLIVSTDRISAFDHILPCGIPGKGRLLTAMSRFWFRRLGVPHHMLSDQLPAELDMPPLEGRCMIVRKAEVVPFECVVRGYLEGSGWREYQAGGEVCGIRLPAGLRQCDRLPEAIFTPATKADEGHDENVSYARMERELGTDLASRLRQLSLEIYRQAAEEVAARGMLVADTKFEFGICDGQLLLVDEVLTPDSSRFWDAEAYRPGNPQPAFDKQYVREWLMESDWDREGPPPRLPDEVIAKTVQKYREAFRRITGRPLTET